MGESLSFLRGGCRSDAANSHRQRSTKTVQQTWGTNAKQRLLSDADLVTLPLADELLDLDNALSEMEQAYPVHVQVVKLKFYAGMTTAEIAAVTNVSIATTERYWAFAKAWLHQRMSGGDNVCKS